METKYSKSIFSSEVSSQPSRLIFSENNLGGFAFRLLKCVMATREDVTRSSLRSRAKMNHEST